MTGRLQRSALVLAAAIAAMPAFAFRIEYGDGRRDELVACDRMLYRGARAEAQSCYRELLTKEDPRLQAEAARSLGDVRAANGYFQTAIDEYPEDAGVRARWGDLFVETHQDNEAVKLFREALELDEDHAPALLGLAEVSAGRFEDRAREWVGQVLDTSPNHIEAHLLLARMDLEEGNIEAADERLSTALELVEQRDEPPLEVYALKASADLLRGIEQSQWTERALDYNPNYGETFAIPAHFYVITRRYREAIALYRRAVEVQPDLYAAHTELGVNLLRENRIDEAQRHLAIAYRGDPFSARIVNTLRLIDSFDNFVVKSFGRAADPDSTEPGVILRLHKDEAEVLEPYVLDLVNRSIDVYTERYGFELAEPVIVELYPEHDDFAVRTSGLPGIGLLGVTFGYLVAMDSPTGRAASEFHWGTTLWHEMAHIFTLEATRHLVPRWFSEGISVYEEWSTGPLPGRHIPLPVFEAIRDDKLLPIAELDSGFIRPTYGAQVIVSYMQAGLICEYIGANWGQAALEKMLTSFRDGADTPAAIAGATGLTAAEFDERFATFVDAELGPVIENLKAWQAAQRKTMESAQGERWQPALEAADRAIELFPDYVDPGSPYLVKARAHRELGEAAAAQAALEAYHRRGGHDPEALMTLAEGLERDGRRDAAIGVLEDLLLVAPLEEQLHTRLGDWLLEAERPAEALTEFQALLAMEPHDRASVHYRLAQAYLRLDDREMSREHLLYALEIAPHYREAQQLLLEIVR
jgi:cellulose synthase operon protein C